MQRSMPDWGWAAGDNCRIAAVENEGVAAAANGEGMKPTQLAAAGGGVAAAASIGDRSAQGGPATGGRLAVATASDASVGAAADAGADAPSGRGAVVRRVGERAARIAASRSDGESRGARILEDGRCGRSTTVVDTAKGWREDAGVSNDALERTGRGTPRHGRRSQATCLGGGRRGPAAHRQPLATLKFRTCNR